MSWCTIESDPGVFTSLIEAIGVKDVQVEELWSLDEEALAAHNPVHGLIFLFKYQKGEPRETLGWGEAPGLFFAQQTISNACATQAFLHILLNSPGLDVGDALRDFKEMTADFPADMRGLAIGNIDSIRVAHNSFSRAEPFISDEKVATDDDDVFHFVAYVPHGGKVFELDGLQEGPIVLGDVGSADWLDVARPAIQERIAKYTGSEIRFNLMAVVKSKLKTAEEAVAAAEAGGDEAGVGAARAEVVRQQELRTGWARENKRRKHNYIPFIVKMIEELAKRGELAALREKAAETAKATREAAKARKDAAEKEGKEGGGAAAE